MEGQKNDLETLINSLKIASQNMGIVQLRLEDIVQKSKHVEEDLVNVAGKFTSIESHAGYINNDAQLLGDSLKASERLKALPTRAKLSERVIDIVYKG